MYHLFILNSNADTFNMEQLDDKNKNYNDLVSRFKDDENCFNNNVKS